MPRPPTATVQGIHDSLPVCHPPSVQTKADTGRDELDGGNKNGETVFDGWHPAESVSQGTEAGADVGCRLCGRRSSAGCECVESCRWQPPPRP